MSSELARPPRRGSRQAVPDRRQRAVSSAARRSRERDLRSLRGAPPATHPRRGSRPSTSGRSTTSRSTSAGRGPRTHRPQRRRQEHAAEDALAHHRADRGAGRAPRARRLAARGRHRLPPRADGAREHLPQRRDPRHDARPRSSGGSTRSSSSPESSVPRHAGQALFERDVSSGSPSPSRPICEPEILLVDEVLAVGDVEFQKKCLGKMQDVTREGRTVLFVSHNLAAIRSLCARSLLLEKGTLVFDGPDRPSARALSRREGSHGREAAVVEGDRTRSAAREDAALRRRADLRAATGSQCWTSLGHRRVRSARTRRSSVEVDYTVIRPVPELRVLVTLTDANQVPVLRTETTDIPTATSRASRARPLPLAGCPAGGLLGDAQLDLNVSLIAELNQVLDYASVLQLDVRFVGHGASMRGHAYLRPALDWRTELLATAAPVPASVAQELPTSLP